MDCEVLDAMNLMGVSLGKFSICVGYRKVMKTLVRLVRWGDDFSSSGRRSLCNAVRDDLGKHLMFKTAAVLGPNNPLEQTAENCTLHVQREVSDGSSSPTLDTLRFWSHRWAW